MVRTYREFTTALVLVLLFLLLFGLVAAGVSDWPGTPEPCVAEDNCYCEAPRPGGVKQPANTLSSLTFTVLGLALLWRTGRERASRRCPRHLNPLTTNAFYPKLYGAVAISIGLGSMLFHGTLKTWGGWLDITSMFSFLTFVNSYNLHRLTRLGKQGFLLLFLLSTASLGILSAVLSIGTYLFMTLGIATLCFELVIQLKVKRFRRGVGLLLAAAVSFVLAVVSWVLSRSPEACNPTSVLQWHVAWHFIAAVDLGLVYEYLRTEESVGGRAPPGNE
jgi:hypothetical protein